MMYPNPRNARSFTYLGDCLLIFNDTIPDEEMRHPTVLDPNNNPCLVVIKCGNTTGLTVDRAKDNCSYARNYYGSDKAETSKGCVMRPSDSKYGAFFFDP